MIVFFLFKIRIFKQKDLSLLKKNMKLECVTICVNYGDFLSSIVSNRTLFNKWIVVTDLHDIHTKSVCDFYMIECIQTDIFYRNGGFDKASGINLAIKQLSSDAWILHMDADIFLPPITRFILNNLKLDPTCIYGIDRYYVKSFYDWNKYITNPTPIYDRGFLLHMAHFEVGARLVHYWTKGESYCPIGFFQLWKPLESGVLTYPEEFHTIHQTDILLAHKFPQENRRLIPDLICFHLESEAVKMGENWNGRKTKYFGLEDKDLSLNLVGDINPIIKDVLNTSILEGAEEIAEDLNDFECLEDLEHLEEIKVVDKVVNKVKEIKEPKKTDIHNSYH